MTIKINQSVALAYVYNTLVWYTFYEILQKSFEKEKKTTFQLIGDIVCFLVVFVDRRCFFLFFSLQCQWKLVCKHGAFWWEDWSCNNKVTCTTIPSLIHNSIVLKSATGRNDSIECEFFFSRSVWWFCGFLFIW